MPSNGTYTLAPPEEFTQEEFQNIKKPRRRSRKCQKYAYYSCGLGFLFIIGALISAIFLEEFLERQILDNMPLAEGSRTFQGFQRPPVRPRMYLYMFNLTNHEDFLAGKSKPKMEELGPYTYSQSMIMSDPEFPDPDILRFTVQRNFTFEPNESVGLDDAETVIVPNIPLFGAMHKLKDEYQIGKNVFKEILNSYDFAQDRTPFLKLTVKEFMWGYKSILLSLQRTESPECSIANEESSFDGWDNFGDLDDAWGDYRAESGVQSENTLNQITPTEAANLIDCDIRKDNMDSFGFMSIRNATKRDLREINTGVSNLTLKGRMISWDDQTKVQYWGSDECNTIRNAHDPSAVPMNIQKSTLLNVFVGELCRKLNFQYHDDAFYDGVKTYRYLPLSNTFDNPEESPENECYCLSSPCDRKSGLFDIESCQPGSPVLISWPHFLFGDPDLRLGVDGMDPDPDAHQFRIDLEPKYGLALSAMAQFQFNVKIVRNNGFGYFDNINAEEVVLPFCYIKEGLPEPSEEMMAQIHLILGLPAKGARIVSLGVMIFGLILMAPELMIWIFNCVDRH
ncbi:scavenger receptor class B member 1-like [Tigriopus californicus]|uniref:scavenger receptor class B member 1-like n=1 Tax=Tigriopus californicus TaxID=6832 RepID=UPI0027DA628D|nr:scavenger receptor class B member 1-like [Tigriopus californicus]